MWPVQLVNNIINANIDNSINGINIDDDDDNNNNNNNNNRLIIIMVICACV